MSARKAPNQALDIVVQYLFPVLKAKAGASPEETARLSDTCPITNLHNCLSGSDKPSFVRTVAARLEKNHPRDGRSTEHDVFPHLHGCDTKGAYTFDVLYGLCRVVLRAHPTDGSGSGDSIIINAEKYRFFGGDEDPDIIYEHYDEVMKQKQNTAAKSSTASLHDLERFVAHLFQLHGVDSTKVADFVRTLKDNEITTTKELAQIPSDDLKLLRDVPIGFLQLLRRNRVLLDAAAFPERPTTDSEIDGRKVARKKREAERAAAAASGSGADNDGIGASEGGGEDKRTTAQLLKQLANVYKIRRLMEYEGGKTPGVFYSMEPLLDNIVKMGIAETQTKYRNPSVLSALRKQFLEPFVLGQSIPRGLLLYGPPGTGKTMCALALIDLCGLQLLEPMMSAGELPQSYVGQTEKLIRDLFERARLFPHLPCIIAIDEIDSAVGKRDSGTGGGGGNNNGSADKLSVFLSAIGGGTDIPNLILVGTTNRREATDEAIRRRMTVQIYVGYLDCTARRDFLMSHLLGGKPPMHLQRHLDAEEKKNKKNNNNNNNNNNSIRELRHFYDFNAFIEKALAVTLNFSGAAFSKLCEALKGDWIRYVSQKLDLHAADAEEAEPNCVWYLPAPKSENNNNNNNTNGAAAAAASSSTTMTTPKESKQIARLLEHVHIISETDDIRVGSQLCFRLLDSPLNRALNQNEIVTTFKNNNIIKRCTGLIVVDLTEPGIFGFEMEMFSEHGETSMTEMKRFQVVNSNSNNSNFHLNDVIRVMSFLVDARSLTQLSVVTLASMITEGATTEEKQSDELATKVRYARNGGRSILMLELDSLANVSRSESGGGGSMGPTSSIGNRTLFNFACSSFVSFRARHRGRGCGMSPIPGSDHSETWCVCVVRSAFIRRELREAGCWVHENERDKREKEEDALRKEVKVCVNCRQRYTREKNEENWPGDCNIHLGPLVRLALCTEQPDGVWKYDPKVVMPSALPPPSSSSDGQQQKPQPLTRFFVAHVYTNRTGVEGLVLEFEDNKRERLMWLCCRSAPDGPPCHRMQHSQKSVDKSSNADGKWLGWNSSLCRHFLKVAMDMQDTAPLMKSVTFPIENEEELERPGGGDRDSQ